MTPIATCLSQSLIEDRLTSWLLSYFVILHPESQGLNLKRICFTRVIFISFSSLGGGAVGDIFGCRVLQLRSGLLQDRSDETGIAASMLSPALQRWSLWLASAAL
jgi:hypothetical protein